MADVSYSLDQIVGLLTQQAQLLRSMKESNNSMGMFGAPFFSTTQNPFSASGSESQANPFSSGFANATGATGGNFFNRIFGLPSAAQLGVGLGANIFQRKVLGTDVSTLGTLPPTTHFGFFQNASKINQEQRMLAAAHFGDKLSTGSLNLFGTGLSMFGGWPGMIAGATVTLGADQVKQQNAYNKYLLQNSFRFINYGESTNTRGMGGFGASERMNAANFLRRFGTENLISDTDTQMLLKSFTEGDLLRNTKDLKSFKDNMQSLTKAVKEGALALNETYESMVGLMSEMKKLGMDPTRAQSYAAGAKAIQGLTGLDASGVLSNIMGASNQMVQGTGISGDTMYNNLQDKLLLTNALYDDVYNKANMGDQSAKRTLNLINNLGGVEGAYRYLGSFEQQFLQNQGAASVTGVLFHDYNSDTGVWEFNESAFNSVMAGDKSNLIERAQAKLRQSGVNAQASWMNSGSEYLSSSLDGAQMMQFVGAYLDQLQERSQFRGQEMTTAEQLKTLLGMHETDAELYGRMADFGGGNVLQQYNSLKMAQEVIDTANANAKGAGYRLTNWWEGTKDWIGDKFSPWAYAGQEIGVWANNWWKGYQYNISDLQTMSGATSIEESTKVIRKALDEISKSLEGVGGTAQKEKDKIDAFKNSLDSVGNNPATFSNGDVTADNLYEAYDNSKWLFAEKLGISNEERDNYNKQLRAYLNVDSSVNDYELMEVALKEYRALYNQSKVKGYDSSLSNSERRFLSSFAGMYGGQYLSSKEEKYGLYQDDYIKINNIGGSKSDGMTTKELEERVKQYGQFLEGGSSLFYQYSYDEMAEIAPELYDKDIASIIASDQFAAKRFKQSGLSGLHKYFGSQNDEKSMKKVRELIEKAESSKQNWNILLDENNASVNKTNVLASYLNSKGIISEDRMKEFQMGEGFDIFGWGDDPGDYNVNDATDRLRNIQSHLVAQLTYDLEDNSASSSLAQEMARSGIDINTLAKNPHDTVAIEEAVSSYLGMMYGNMSSAPSEEIAEAEKKLTSSVDTVSEDLDALSTAVTNAATKINTVVDKIT